MKKKATELSPALVNHLQGKSIVFLQAAEPESLSIYSTALSWVYATHPTSIYFAIDSKSAFLKILEQNPRVTLNTIGCETAYAIAGKAKVKEEKAEGISIHLALIEVEVEEVRDVMFFGGKVVTEPEFIKTYDQKLIDKLDREVHQAVMCLAKN